MLNSQYKEVSWIQEGVGQCPGAEDGERLAQWAHDYRAGCAAPQQRGARRASEPEPGPRCGQGGLWGRGATWSGGHSAWVQSARKGGHSEVMGSVCTLAEKGTKYVFSFTEGVMGGRTQGSCEEGHTVCRGVWGPRVQPLQRDTWRAGLVSAEQFSPGCPCETWMWKPHFHSSHVHRVPACFRGSSREWEGVFSFPTHLTELLVWRSMSSDMTMHTEGC